MHRGTLTSQSATKVGNRRCERLLREAELWWVGRRRRAARGRRRARALWKDVLLQQFHDIIPGSSIAWVAADAEAAHARVAERLEALIADALAIARAGRHLGRQRGDARSPRGDRRRRRADDGRGTRARASPQLATGSMPVDHPVVVTEHSMNNGLISVGWNLDGAIISIIDVVRGRQLLPAGEADHAGARARPSRRVRRMGPRVVDRSLGSAITSAASVELVTHGIRCWPSSSCAASSVTSSLTQTYTMRAGSARLDIALRHRLARGREAAVADGAARRAHPRGAAATSSSATSSARRTRAARGTPPSSRCARTASSTSAEPSFGVAVLNDGRYGHGVQDGGVRVSLLRAAKYPDPDADHGRHAVTISVLPHGPGSARRAARGRGAEHAAAGRVRHGLQCRRRRSSRSTIAACRSAA